MSLPISKRVVSNLSGTELGPWAVVRVMEMMTQVLSSLSPWLPPQSTFNHVWNGPASLLPETLRLGLYLVSPGHPADLRKR